MWKWPAYKRFDRIPPLPSAWCLGSTRSPQLCFQTPYWSTTSIASAECTNKPTPHDPLPPTSLSILPLSYHFPRCPPVPTPFLFFLFIPLNSPAVGVAWGLVLLWWYQQLRRLLHVIDGTGGRLYCSSCHATPSQSQSLDCKMEHGSPLGEATPRTLPLKALSRPAATD